MNAADTMTELDKLELSWSAVLCRGLSGQERVIRELAIHWAVADDDTREIRIGLTEIDLWRSIGADPAFENKSFAEASVFVDRVMPQVHEAETAVRYHMNRKGHC